MAMTDLAFCAVWIIKIGLVAALIHTKPDLGAVPTARAVDDVWDVHISLSAI